jgi:PAS domain S-box-containing protein
VLIFEHGRGFLWLQITGYLLVLIIIINLWLASRRGSEISRRQGRLLLFALLFPLVANLIYIFEVVGLEGVDWTSITFSITGFLILRALYGQQLLDLIPVARDKLVSSMGDGMIVVDTRNRIIDINQTAANMIGVPAETLLGRDLTEVAAPTRPFLEQPYENEIKNELEVGSTSKRYFDFLISPLREGRRGITGRLIIFRDITERKRNELHLVQLSRELQETQAQVVEQQRTFAKLEERQRLGRDMHDSVNQSIHSLMLFSETLNVLLEKNQVDKAIDVAKRIEESGRQALKEIRLLLFETQSLLAEDIKDLMIALEERLNMVERRVGIKAELNYQGAAVVDYPPEWNENLYWITIEALNNSLKHSHSRKIQVNLSYMGKHLSLDIRDDGSGFDPRRIQTGGLGMRSMRERAELLGGQLNITSSPGNGTSVNFHVETEAVDG